MPTSIELVPVLIFLFFAIVLGFGFAIGQQLWSALVGAIRRSP